MTSERQTQVDIFKAWGHHPRIRIARINTGVGWFSGGKPASKATPGAYPVHFGVPGTADIVGLIKPTGRMLMIEVKSAKGRQRTAQETMQRIVTEFGGLYIVARSVIDVDKALALIGIIR